MESQITITEAEKTGWHRLALAAYGCGNNPVGHRYSAAAALPSNTALPVPFYDRLQKGYRDWLCLGLFPVKEG